MRYFACVGAPEELGGDIWLKPKSGVATGGTRHQLMYHDDFQLELNQRWYRFYQPISESKSSWWRDLFDDFRFQGLMTTCYVLSISMSVG